MLPLMTYVFSKVISTEIHYGYGCQFFFNFRSQNIKSIKNLILILFFFSNFSRNFFFEKFLEKNIFEKWTQSNRIPKTNVV
jgi:hypothetical protein